MEESKTILLVEDETAVRTLLSQSLQRYGFALLEAASGPDALEMTRHYSRTIHVLVSDVMMPGMTGVELAKELCSQRPSLKVVLISGYSDLPPLEKDWVFLQKPFPPSVLTEKIARLCARCGEACQAQPETAAAEETLRKQMRIAREAYAQTSQEYERLVVGGDLLEGLERVATLRKDSLQTYADSVRQFAEFQKRKPGAPK